MRKVRADHSETKRRRVEVDDDAYEYEEVRISSVLFGLAMLIALTVAAAAWMGGSLSQIESRFANAVDGAARSVGLGVVDVQVYGLEHDPQLEGLVRGAAMIEPGENMFRANPFIIRGRIEQTGRVLNVRVHRLWPGQIIILADKADATAMMMEDGAGVLFDALGRQVAPAPEQSYADLLVLEGQGAPVALPGLLGALVEAPSLARQVETARRVAGQRWTLVLRSGLEVKLPSDADLETAIKRFEALERRTTLSGRNIAAIDLRAPGSVFITPNTTKTIGGTA